MGEVIVRPERAIQLYKAGKLDRATVGRIVQGRALTQSDRYKYAEALKAKPSRNKPSAKQVDDLRKAADKANPAKGKEAKSAIKNRTGSVRPVSPLPDRKPNSRGAGRGVSSQNARNTAQANDSRRLGEKQGVKSTSQKQAEKEKVKGTDKSVKRAERQARRIKAAEVNDTRTLGHKDGKADSKSGPTKSDPTPRNKNRRGGKGPKKQTKNQKSKAKTKAKSANVKNKPTPATDGRKTPSQRQGGAAPSNDIPNESVSKATEKPPTDADERGGTKGVKSEKPPVAENKVGKAKPSTAAKAKKADKTAQQKTDAKKLADNVKDETKAKQASGSLPKGDGDSETRRRQDNRNADQKQRRAGSAGKEAKGKPVFATKGKIDPTTGEVILNSAKDNKPKQKVEATKSVASAKGHEALTEIERARLHKQGLSDEVINKMDLEKAKKASLKGLGKRTPGQLKGFYRDHGVEYSQDTVEAAKKQAQGWSDKDLKKDWAKTNADAKRLEADRVSGRATPARSAPGESTRAVQPDGVNGKTAGTFTKSGKPPSQVQLDLAKQQGIRLPEGISGKQAYPFLGDPVANRGGYFANPNRVVAQGIPGAKGGTPTHFGGRVIPQAAKPITLASNLGGQVAPASAAAPGGTASPVSPAASGGVQQTNPYAKLGSRTNALQKLHEVSGKGGSPAPKSGLGNLLKGGNWLKGGAAGIGGTYLANALLDQIDTNDTDSFWGGMAKAALSGGAGGAAYGLFSGGTGVLPAAGIGALLGAGGYLIGGGPDTTPDYTDSLRRGDMREMREILNSTGTDPGLINQLSARWTLGNSMLGEDATDEQRRALRAEMMNVGGNIVGVPAPMTPYSPEIVGQFAKIGQDAIAPLIPQMAPEKQGDMMLAMSGLPLQMWSQYAPNIQSANNLGMFMGQPPPAPNMGMPAAMGGGFTAAPMPAGGF